MAQDINTIIPQEAKDDLVFINTELEKTVKTVVELGGESRKLRDMLGGAGNVKSIKEHLQVEQQLLTVMQSLEVEAKKHNILLQEQVKITNALKVAEAQQAIDSLKNNELNEKGIKAVTNAKKALHSEYAKGKISMNQYKSATFEVTQLIRELPAFAYGANVGIGALSNNIPMLMTRIERLREAGMSAGQIFNVLGKSIFGVTNLLTIGVAVFTIYGAQIIEAFRGTEKLINAHTELNKVVKEAGSSYAEAGAELESMKRRFMEAGASAETKKDIIAQLNEKYSDTIGHIDGINEGEDFFVNRSAAFVEAMKIRAELSAVYQQIGKNVADLAVNESKLYQDNTTGIEKFSAGVKAAAFTPLWAVAIKGLDAYRDKYKGLLFDLGYQNLIKQTNDAERSTKHLETLGDGLADRLQQINKEFNFDFVKPEKVKGEIDLLNAQIKAETDLVKAKSEKAKAAYEQAAMLNDAIVQDEAKSYTERLNALTYFGYHKKNVIMVEREAELDAVNSKLDAIAAIESKAAEKRTPAEKRLLLQKQAMEAQKAAIVAKYETEALGVTLAVSKKRTDLVKKERDDIEDYFTDGVNKIADNYEKQQADQQTTLIESLANRKISVNQFEVEQQNIQRESHRNKLKDTITYLEDVLKEEKISAEAREKLEGDLSDAKIKLNEDTANSIIQTSKKVGQVIRDMAYEITGLTGDIANNKIAAIDEEDEKIEKSKELRLKGIQAVKMADEERAKAEIQVENDALAAHTENAIEKRKLRRQQALLEKAAAAAEIIQRTAIAIMTTLGDKSIPNAYTRIALSIGMGVTGGVQLGRVLAADIPEYKTGKKGHPGGPAIVGDGYEMERIDLPSGHSFMSPAKPTLMDLPRGVDVTPLSKLLADSTGMLTPQLAATPHQQGNNNFMFARSINNGLQDVKEAINRKPVPYTSFRRGYMYEAVKKGSIKSTKNRKHIID